ncbi:MFS transporter [Pseudogracilibacillus auburnensis]|uniref:FSR family fosmidomycin resistance protein-like MFS transporter n=1 Tax=Pseudogracilibacillus auburnensis TaxID=1494959 RepID=A0A2V3VZQ8_9BACI|nr:MFS transporter [Pseudogracilibacillus auburnensis]MBO1002217.1 MFS transporter [Pseudogracilibacillus auburnensis]PXW87547.1 FSR family fosmidomycin resistance protein-like MFS transporter [Pseudogracilibacillus auburnensis]
MSTTAKSKQTSFIGKAENQTIYPILFIIGICHLLNDSLQAVIPAMFPILESSLGLTFTQLGLIAFTLNMVSSVMQPVIGMYTDKRPMPFALPIGLTSSMLGMLGLAFAPNFEMILVSVFFIGIGSATFHPEGSRVAYLAAGPRRGLAQSIFQVGGNTGSALAPLITALVLVPLGQFGAVWFTFVAGLAVLFLIYIAKWYTKQMISFTKNRAKTSTVRKQLVPKQAIRNALIVLIFLVFARSWYQSAISNFYAFYAIDVYGITIAKAQIFIFTFLLLGAVGTFFGGPLADRFGKRNVILLSLLGSAPLAVLLPFVNNVLAIILLCLIGLFLMSSFSVTVVYAQELVPGKIGTMSGLIVGLAFGMGAIGSVALGSLIDWIGLSQTMIFVSFLPLLGLLTFLLPTDEKVAKWYAS